MGPRRPSSRIIFGGTDGTEVLIATLDLEDAETARTSLPWWCDRRPELYAPLSAA